MHAPRLRPVLLAVVLLALCSAPVAVGTAQEATPASGTDVTILGPDESYADVTRGEWSARWWQWATSLPAEISPFVNETGTGCGYGQHGPMFFLPASYAPEPPVTTCVVPEGTAIFVPILMIECSTVEPAPYFGRDEEELRACAEGDIVTATAASVNGQDVVDLDAYRVTSPLFTLNLPEGNLFDVPVAVAQSVAVAHAFIIAPPAPGVYEIAVTGTFEEGSTPYAITYQVVVEAPQVIEPVATPAA